MATGARVTDEIDFYKRRGQLQSAVRVIRARTPERLRWRAAVAQVTQAAGGLRGRERMRIEEPVREIVLDLGDRILRRESVLDARKSGVDLDRGEVLIPHTRWDLRRTAFLTGVNHEDLSRYIRMPAEYSRPIDTAAVILVARALGQAHKQRADRLLARLPNPTDVNLMNLARHELYMFERAERDKDLARRWIALAKVMIDGSR